MELTRKKIAIASAVAVALLLGGWLVAGRLQSAPPLSADGMAEFKAPPRSPDFSSEIVDKLATAQPPNAERPEIKLPPPPASTGMPPPASLPTPALSGPAAQGFGAVEMDAHMQAAFKQAQGDAQKAMTQGAQTQPLQGDAVMQHLSRYGTPVTKQLLPVGGVTVWTVISKSGKPVQLYTTADGKALFSGVVWNLETGQNVSEALMVPPTGADPNFATRLPQVVAPTTPKSNLVSGPNALPSAFDGKAPTQIPEAIRLVDGLAGYKEGKGGPGETLYIIIDPRCPYCRRAYLNTREHVKAGATIKWIPTVALGRPEQGLPLAATILRSSSPDAVARVLGNHEQINTPPTDFEIKQLDNNLDFMFEAFKQNNEPNPGVPVAFFVDRRSGKARMMMGVSEQVVIEDILGKPKK